MLKFTENMPQKYLSSATILVRLSPLRTLYEYGRWRGDSAILYIGFSCSRLLSMHLGHTHPSLLLLLCYIVLSREWQRSLLVPSRRERVQFLTYTKEEEGCTCTCKWSRSVNSNLEKNLRYTQGWFLYRKKEKTRVAPIHWERTHVWVQPIVPDLKVFVN